MGQYRILGLANQNTGNNPYKIIGRAEAPIQEQSQGVSSIPGDIANKAIDLVMGAGEKAMALPDEISEAANSIAQRPVRGSVRGIGNLAGGLLEGAKGLYNLPLNLNTYLGSKGIFPFKQTMGLAEKLKVGDTGLLKSIMGEEQKGDQLFKDLGMIAPIAFAPEKIASRIPSVSSKGILRQLSKEKSKRLASAKSDYNNLFSEAAFHGITHTVPPKSVTSNQLNIIKNSQPKYHQSLKEYAQNPTIENAHWAQSELGALERHLDKIDKKNGLTPSQMKTLNAVKEARTGIKESMFSKNSLGKNPELATQYEQLGNKYRQEVIPYTSLEDLSQFESGKIRPKTAVKNLLSDEEFMINLAKKYPGIFLHTPTARNIGLGAAGVLGYDEIKRLLKSSGQ